MSFLTYQKQRRFFYPKAIALTVSGKEEDVPVEPPKPQEAWVKEAAKSKGWTVTM